MIIDETFTIPLAVDLVAVGIGSLQGAMFAAGFRRIDLLGITIIGIACGVGGGFLRDILLGVTPVALSHDLYLVVCAGSAILGMLLGRALQRVDPVVTSLDALSIGMFGAIGTTKALAAGLPVAPALFIGMVSAVGGGAVRDLLLNLPIAVMHVGSLYAVASLIGVGVLTVLVWLGVPVMIAGVVCVVVTAAVRLLAVRFGWSLPEQRALSRIRLRKQRQVEDAIEEALATGAITLPDLADLQETEGGSAARTGPDDADPDDETPRRGRGR